jgi:hypothetical protein
MVRRITTRGVPMGEDTAGIHLDCLYMIPESVRKHAPPARNGG